MHAQLNQSIRVEPAVEGRFSVEFSFPNAFIGFDGHFPGQPILPGVCLVQAVLMAAQTATGRQLELDEVVLAKFLSIIRPDDGVTAACRVDTKMVRAKVSRGEERVAEVRLRVHNA